MWMTTIIIISDDYMLKKFTQLRQSDQILETHYKIFDLKKHVIHSIEDSFRSSTHVDSFNNMEINIRGYRNGQPIKTKLKKLKFQGGSCKKEIVTRWRSDMYDIGLRKDSEIAYYASIAVLDSLLDTNDKLDFAGFKKRDYTPFHFPLLSYTVTSYGDTLNMRTMKVEKGFMDMHLIDSLLSIPLRKKK